MNYRRPAYELGLAATDGRLLEIIGEMRANDYSFHRIAGELAVQYGFLVSSVTVKKWLDENQPSNEPSAA